MDTETVLVWDKADALANDILRECMRRTKYAWVWRKLNHARWHIIETHTVRVPYCLAVDPQVVRNGHL